MKEPIIGQECICPDGLGRVVAFDDADGIRVQTYIANRDCIWAAANVELIDPRNTGVPVMVKVDISPPLPKFKVNALVRHKKTSTEYVITANDAKMKVGDVWLSAYFYENADGWKFARQADAFEDGRFEEVANWNYPWPWRRKP